jgi:phage baseplate assembly protein W
MTSDPGKIFGRGISFPPRIGADGRIAWSDGEVNIREAIRIILMTEPGERLRLRDFGGGLPQFLFEPNTVTTHRLIQDRIARVLDVWEPRISVESIIVDGDPADPQAAVVTITYRLVATQARERIDMSVRLAG